MSLLFAAGTTDKVTVPNPQTIGAGSEFTWFQWVKFNAAPANGRGFGKGGIDCLVYFSGYFMEVPRASVAAVAALSSDIPLNSWYFVAGTYSEADGPRLFRGEIHAPLVEESYSSRTVGTGGTNADSGDLFIGNRNASSSQAPPCNVRTFAWFNRRLSLTELRQQQVAPMPDVGCTYFSHVGLFGRFALDESGFARTGQITGTAPGEVPALRMPMPGERRGLNVMPVMV